MERFSVKKQDTAHRKLADEAIVVNFISSFFYNFNLVSAHIRERYDGKHNVAQIAGKLTEEFEVSLEEATQDRQKFIDGLIAEGLLTMERRPVRSGDCKRL
jgi:hypothetical protein